MYNMDDSSQEEQKKIHQMRALVEKRDPTSKEYDDLTIRRFLRARDLQTDKACDIFLKGIDKLGRPILLIFSGKHYPNKIGGVEEFKRYVVFALDKLCSRIPQGQEKFAVIADLKGWGYSNCDIRGYLAALNLLQDCYPERLGKLFMVNTPSMFTTALKTLYPFIDANTKKKIIFVDKKQLKATLLKDIDEDQLPEIYGGKLKLVAVQDS